MEIEIVTGVTVCIKLLSRFRESVCAGFKGRSLIIMLLASNKRLSSLRCSDINSSACDVLLARSLLPRRIWDRSLLSVQELPGDKDGMVVCMEPLRQIPAPGSCPTVAPSCRGASRQPSA